MEENVISYLGRPGCMLSYSKSQYRDEHPTNLVVFNSNVCIDEEKVWFGDLDITESKSILFDISKDFNKPVYVLFEMDGRFGLEGRPDIDKYAVKFNPDGTYELNKRYNKEEFPL